MTFPNYSLPNFNKEIIKINKLSNGFPFVTTNRKAYNNTPIVRIEMDVIKIVNIDNCFNWLTLQRYKYKMTYPNF